MFDVFFALEKDGKRELLYKDCGLFLGQLAKLADKAPSGLEAILSQLQPDFTLLDSVTQDLGALYALHERVNAAIIESIDHMDNFSKLETLSLGENLSFTKPRFQLILALLTHTAHHRGQIAGALDMLQIPNDFASTMLGM